MKYRLMKVLIVVLAFLTVLGTVGFGVYSYFYSNSGKMNFASSASKYTSSFNPNVSLDGDSGFLSGSYEISTQNCNRQDWHETLGREVICTSTMTVSNDGNSTLDVDVYDLDFDGMDLSTYPAFALVSSSFTADEEQFRLEPDENKEVTFTFKYIIDYDKENGIDVGSSAPYAELYYEASGNAKVKATQVVE